MLRWLVGLGPLGLLAVAAIDSSGIPLLVPGSTDLLLLWLVSRKGNLWLLVLCAVAGSTLGGYTAWSAGRRGGQAALRHHVPSRYFERTLAWVERHTILSVFLPALMPPPILVGPLVIASGALGVSRRRFLAVYGTARSLRYGLVAWLGVVYGRSVARLWSAVIEKWSVPLICVFVAMLAAGVCLAVWQARRSRKPHAAHDHATQNEAMQAR